MTPMAISKSEKKSEKKNTKRGLKVLAMTGGLVLVGTAAFAFWTQGGSGTGSASTGTTTGITVNQTSTVSNLAPGSAAQALSGNFTNPNSGPVQVATVTVSFGTITKATGAPAGTCDASDYVLTNAVMNVNAQIAAGNGVGNWSGATLGFVNKTTNQDACKGATVNLVYTAA